ncbi:MAG: hypothetical protein U1B30_13290 [Pseudomonadota bacterium]|nr:hypothetical protein [Pseudomonadota bacterium]
MSWLIQQATTSKIEEVQQQCTSDFDKLLSMPQAGDAKDGY